MPRDPNDPRRAWIETIAPEHATGLLAKLYDAAIARAGKVFNVLRVQSLRPETLRISTMLYREIMFGKTSPLSRAQRELIATVVSRANACEY
jgi:alkylhydroperoxidase family enzyme